MATAAEKRFCVIIPAYQEAARIGPVVRAFRRYCSNVIVVDDGSIDVTAEEARAAGAIVIRHEQNRGKGAAVRTGVEYARQHGFEFVITADGDGQHDAEDVPRFVELFLSTGAPVIVGNRMENPSGMPLIRRLTNRYMSWLLSRKMGRRVPDTQCGYRLYRTDVIASLPAESGRFAAESEVLMALADRGIPIAAVPIRVIYRDEKSKINPLKDTIRFFKMLHRYQRRKKSST